MKNKAKSEYGYGIEVKFSIKKKKKHFGTEEAQKRLAKFAKQHIKESIENIDYLDTISNSNFEKITVFANRLYDLNKKFVKTKSEKTKTQIMIDAEYEMYFVLYGIDQGNINEFERVLIKMLDSESSDPRLYKVLVADYYRHVYYVYNDGDVNSKFYEYWSHTLDNPDDDKIIALFKNVYTGKNLLEQFPDNVKELLKTAKDVGRVQGLVESLGIAQLAQKMKAITNFHQTKFNSAVNSMCAVFDNKSPNPIRKKVELLKGGSDEREEERKDIEESTESSVQE